MLGFEQHKHFVDKAGALAPAEAEALLFRLIQWRGERNLLPAGSTSMVWGIDGKRQLPHGPRSLDEWQRFWGVAEAEPLEGPPLYQRGNLLSRTDAALDELSPDDFRLREDSAGYRAGPDGKDLGADVDLVGPGAAYERWKKTPEYQEWLEETESAKRHSTGAGNQTSPDDSPDEIRVAAAKKALEELQGTWSLVAAEAGGEQISGEDKSWIWTIEGDKWRWP
jgi:hypothetical protein